MVMLRVALAATDSRIAGLSYRLWAPTGREGGEGQRRPRTSSPNPRPELLAASCHYACDMFMHRAAVPPERVTLRTSGGAADAAGTRGTLRTATRAWRPGPQST